jgi:hypothetical protein
VSHCAGTLAWVPLIRTPRAPAAPAATTSAAPPRSLLRDPLAWQVTVFFGLQSLSFYAVLAWLPSIYRDAGMPPAAAGLLLSVATLVQAPAGLVIPRLAALTRLADDLYDTTTHLDRYLLEELSEQRIGVADGSARTAAEAVNEARNALTRVRDAAGHLSSLLTQAEAAMLPLTPAPQQ